VYKSSRSESPLDPQNKKTRLLIVGECDVRLWSLDPAERHRRLFAQVGVNMSGSHPHEDGGTIVAIRADYLISPDLVVALATRSNTVLTTPGGDVAVAANVTSENLGIVLESLRSERIKSESEIILGLDFLGPNALSSKYDSKLRKRATPFVLSYRNTPLDELEIKTFGAAYKGATDFVTKWFWPKPARIVTRWAAARGMSPNNVTTASLTFMLLALWLFAEGHFLSALPVAWAMTFLDTVDGKLARVTVTSSLWGNIYDHGIDLIHPPFWWYGWYVGVLPMTSPAVASLVSPAIWVILVGYVLGRLLEGLFELTFKIETHIWQPIDYFFRTITARRNSNLAILTVACIFQRPDIGFLCVAVWTILSLSFHAIRLLQATLIHLQGGHIESWLNPGARD
tara:strand:- start:1053 stop:2246 length:1194 start_codon:yes stop_codon:yes gene_type:complete